MTWRWVNMAAAVATLAFLVWRLGTGPFLDGLRAVDAWALAAASGLAVLTTIGSAWRWRIVARATSSDASACLTCSTISKSSSLASS